MKNYGNMVKNKLNSLIMDMEKNAVAFVADPQRDFVRKSELSFSKTMKFILGMGSQSLGKELMEFYGFDSGMVSVSAIVQRRAKILPSAFHHLFQAFNRSFSVTNFFHGYRLYAVDGTDVHIPLMPHDHATHYCSTEGSNGYNLMHLNAIYDLVNRRYMDAVLQDSREENENTALIRMLEQTPADSIIVADRNYDSYNNIAHLERKGLKYVIRIKSKVGIVQKFHLPLDEEADFTAKILLTRRQTKEVKEHPEIYRFLASNSTFDFLPKGSKETFPLMFRIIRIRISEDLYETLVTNLWEDEFSAEEIKQIYKLRWGIETSFRELKYHVGLIAFHSKKKDCVIQEIFASLIMYNFAMLITENILIKDRNSQFRQKINYAVAIFVCICYFRSSLVKPSELEKLIARNVLPIRPDRKAVRNTSCHSAISFAYRLS